MQVRPEIFEQKFNMKMIVKSFRNSTVTITIANNNTWNNLDNIITKFRQYSTETAIGIVLKHKDVSKEHACHKF